MTVKITKIEQQNCADTRKSSVSKITLDFFLGSLYIEIRKSTLNVE